MKKIGIVGGMGPLATLDLFAKILQHTKAKTDQDNIPILIHNNPQVPDRTQSILYGGESPVPTIIKMGRDLEEMGADFLLMPCNTSHYYYNQIQESLNIKLVNMIDLVVDHLVRAGYKRVCVLGTEGTIKTKVYENKLREKNIYSVPIHKDMIKMLQYVIYDVVKSNNFPPDLKGFRQELKKLEEEEEVEVFVLGCTELPILFEKYDLDFRFIDPTVLLAKEAIKLAKVEE